MRFTSIESFIYVIISIYHGLVEGTLCVCCREITDIDPTFVSRLADMIPRRRRQQNCSKLGFKFQTDKFCTKKQANCPTSGCNGVVKCGYCESFCRTISAAFCTETRGCLRVIRSQCSQKQRQPIGHSLANFVLDDKRGFGYRRGPVRATRPREFDLSESVNSAQDLVILTFIS